MQKLKILTQHSNPSQQIANYLMKMDVLRDLITKEELSGNKIAEAVYRVRFVRIAQMDVHGDLAAACRLLKEGGMDHSARFIAKLITNRVYNSSEESVEFVKKFFLPEVIEKAIPIQETIVIDNRKESGYELSCIVSIFKEGKRAADCLKRIADQSLYKDGKLEIIFVDSNSPADEGELLLQDHSRTLHFVYIKTSHTEKLSAAWNRGVKHAKSEFLTFTAPSNLFIENAFEILLRPFQGNGSLVLTQGDVGEPCIEEPPMLSIVKTDLKAITIRRADEIQQVIPFFFINYLAFDCCVVRKKTFEEIGGFDSSFTCAAENKFHLNVLGKGQIQQVGEMIEGAFEEKGPRLTVHPRIEIEHFQAMYEAFGCEAMVQSAKQDPAWNKKSEESILKDLISLSLKYPIPYPERVPGTYYDLEKARSISQFALSKFPGKAIFWNDRALLDLRDATNHSLLHLSYSAKLDGKKSILLNWNIVIIRLVRWLLSFTFLYSHQGRVREVCTLGTRSKSFGTIIRKISRVIFRTKTMSPDMYGETIW